MVQAYVLGKLCKVDGCEENDVVQQIKAISGVQEVNLVYGKYDIIAKVNGPSLENIKEIISETIRKIPGIEYTQTLISAQ